jgi:hypothetical protein
MARKTQKKPVAAPPQTPPATVKRVRRVEPIVDELYHWIKTGVDNKTV